MLNNSSQKAQIFFPFSISSTKWACDPENINFHQGAGAPGDVIVEPILATGALSSRVRHSSCTAHKLNYLNIRTTLDVYHQNPHCHPWRYCLLTKILKLDDYQTPFTNEIMFFQKDFDVKHQMLSLSLNSSICERCSCCV